MTLTGPYPYGSAPVNGEPEVVALLLKAGADPDRESAGAGSEGLPLCAAACWGHVETVRVLRAYGADPEAREDRGAGRTAVEWAVDAGQPETVRALRGG
ncbi:ankyrin repeat domain-containing protein [Streptomyces sp. NPDC087294]|uniref:ankyrin repeat domain-containing protein n=1 Tax=Streptomyces sp. NPDC087294 TaxID=3365777 RepID=UPI0037FC420F